MKILVVDTSMESQVQVARVFDMLSQSDRDMLDLRINLAGDKNYLERILESDVLIVGPGLSNRATEIAHAAKNVHPDIEIILFVTDESYSSHVFRQAHSARARKVLPLSAPSMDLLQELLMIHEARRVTGKTRDGRVVVLLQVKGGLGSTTLCAALGEACSLAGKKTLLWDLDIESKDLSRSLLVHEGHGMVIGSWVNGSREVSRESLQDAMVALNENAWLLPPPDTMPSGMDLLAQLEGINIAQKVIDLARVTHDCILIDTGGRMCPLTGTLLRVADLVLVLVDDSVLGMSAVPSYLNAIRQYLLSNEVVKFVCSGTKASADKIAAKVDPEKLFDRNCWSMPSYPFDAAAASWPGTGKTLFTVGHKKTRQALDKLADCLGLYTARGFESRTSKRLSVERMKNILWLKGSLTEKTPILRDRAVGMSSEEN